jgi:predicted heme/steroid binding protein
MGAAAVGASGKAGGAEPTGAASGGAGGSSVEAVRTIDLAELSQHATTSSCWMAVAGIVYDVTLFLHEHPGGDEILVESAGKDATSDVSALVCREG